MWLHAFCNASELVIRETFEKAGADCNDKNGGESASDSESLAQSYLRRILRPFLA
jgi:hypothetical protein